MCLDCWWNNWIVCKQKDRCAWKSRADQYISSSPKCNESFIGRSESLHEIGTGPLQFQFHVFFLSIICLLQPSTLFYVYSAFFLNSFNNYRRILLLGCCTVDNALVMMEKQNQMLYTILNNVFDNGNGWEREVRWCSKRIRWFLPVLSSSAFPTVFFSKGSHLYQVHSLYSSHKHGRTEIYLSEEGGGRGKR